MRPTTSAFLAALLAAPVWSQVQPPQPVSPDVRLDDGLGIHELDADTQRAIEEGVQWLADAQHASGCWSSKPSNYRMSVTALAGLALLAHGDTPDSGRYSGKVLRTVEWMLKSQLREGPWAGLFFDGAYRDPTENLDEQQRKVAEDNRPMHGHGFALLFLAEAYGATRDERLRRRVHESIAMGCRLTERTMSPDGGWYYHPSSRRDEGSVTITQIQGLRSAHNAGINVDEKVIKRAIEYIRASQMEDGGIRYTRLWGKTSPALTAAGVSVLHACGEYSSKTVERCYDYLRQNLRTESEQHPFFFYTHLYAVQAMHQRGGPEWASYYPRIRRELLDMRRGCPWWESQFGREYGTANALLILEVPLRYLPIYQR